MNKVDTGTIHAPRMDGPRLLGNVATEYKDMIDMCLGINSIIPVVLLITWKLEHSDTMELNVRPMLN